MLFTDANTQHISSFRGTNSPNIPTCEQEEQGHNNVQPAASTNRSYQSVKQPVDTNAIKLSHITAMYGIGTVET